MTDRLSSPRIRPEILALLADHDPVRSSFARQPWRLVHCDGRAFTPRESQLVNTATLAELTAAQRVAAARRDDLQRVYDVLSRVHGGEGDPAGWPELLSRLPTSERAEVEAILERYPDHRAELEAG